MKPGSSSIATSTLLPGVSRQQLRRLLDAHLDSLQAATGVDLRRRIALDEMLVHFIGAHPVTAQGLCAVTIEDVAGFVDQMRDLATDRALAHATDFH